MYSAADSQSLISFQNKTKQNISVNLEGLKQDNLDFWQPAIRKLSGKNSKRLVFNFMSLNLHVWPRIYADI